MEVKKKMGKKLKRRLALGITGMLLFTTGCLQTPDIEYVTNKEGQNTLISDNSVMVSGDSIAEQAHAPERIEDTCEKVNEYTSIEIKANVVVPEGNAVPVYRVTPMEITSEQVENYTGILYGDSGFYNCPYNEYGYEANRTEEVINKLIEDYLNCVNTAVISDTPEPVLDENGTVIEMNEEDKQVYLDNIENLQAELEEVKDAPTYGDSISYEFEPLSHDQYLSEYVTYNYEYEAAAFTGRYEGKEYNLAVIKDGVNTELHFELKADSILENGYRRDMVNFYSEFEKSHGSMAEKTNSCQYSEEEAMEMSREFLRKLGICNMEVGHVEDLHLVTWPSGKETYLGNKGYRCYFYWGNETMSDSYSSQDEYLGDMASQQEGMPVLCSEVVNSILEPENEESYNLRMYQGIAIISVLDDGIVEVWIQNPVEDQEVLAENVKLLNFEKVLEQGKAYLETLYGDSGTSSFARRDIIIRTIELNYARMQAPDKEGEFTMIPVWDFKTGPDGEIMVSINAIDGSRFNREQGY